MKVNKGIQILRFVASFSGFTFLIGAFVLQILYIFKAEYSSDHGLDLMCTL